MVAKKQTIYAQGAACDAVFYIQGGKVRLTVVAKNGNERQRSYASKVQQTIEPISRKIQDFQQSAGNFTNNVHPTKKVPEVRLQESPNWPDYLVRGVGSVWGVLIIAGVVPFLTFFMLCTKDQMAIRMDGFFDSRINATRFITNLNQMIRGFVAGNLIVGP